MQFLCFLFVFSVGVKCLEYKESLVLEPLRDGKVVASFEFVNDREVSEPEDVFHNGLFPQSVSDIIVRNKIRMMTFSLTRGTWNSMLWGQPPSGANAHGYELISSFQNNINNMERLLGDVSRFLCTPFLNTRYVRSHIFGDTAYGNSTFYASFPEGSVCTENLYTWLNLIPYSENASLKGLITPRLFRSYYNSMSFCIRVEKDGKRGERWILTQRLVSVIESPVEQDKISWTLRDLFGVADRTETINIPHKDIVISQKKNTCLRRENLLRAPTLTEDGLFTYRSGKIDMNIGVQDLPRYRNTCSFHLTVTRALSGNFGLHGFILNTEFENRSGHTYKIEYMDVIPWQVRVYMHTLKATITHLHSGRCDKGDVEISLYTPSGVSKNPSVIENMFILHPYSRISFSLYCEPKMLKISDFFYAPNKGLVLGPSRAVALDLDTMESHFLPTSPLLVQFPVPDFTMPFNVISLTFTTFTIFYSLLLNTIVNKCQYEA